MLERRRIWEGQRLSELAGQSPCPIFILQAEPPRIDADSAPAIHVISPSLAFGVVGGT